MSARQLQSLGCTGASTSSGKETLKATGTPWQGPLEVAVILWEQQRPPGCGRDPLQAAKTPLDPLEAVGAHGRGRDDPLETEEIPENGRDPLEVAGTSWSGRIHLEVVEPPLKQ